MTGTEAAQAKGSGSRPWGLGPLLGRGNASSVIALKPRGDVWAPAGGGSSPTSLEPTGRPTPRQGRVGPPAPRQDPATALPPRPGTVPLPPLTPALGWGRRSAAGPSPGMMMPNNPLILCCPLLLPHSIFPSIRVFSIPLGLALGSPIFPSGCEGKLGVALESLQGLRDLT